MNDIGTPLQAIEYVLTLDDYADIFEFLTDWTHGSVELWDGYQDFIAPRQAGMQNPYAKHLQKDKNNGN